MKKWIALFIALCMLSALLPAFAEDGSQELWGPVAHTVDELEAMVSGDEAVTTIITEPFYEGVTDEDQAMEAMDSVLDRLGGDDTTMLMLDSVLEYENGLTYYTFRQIVGDVTVFAASAKLIVDQNGTAVCAVSSLVPGLPAALESAEGITGEEAEQIVAQGVSDQKMKVLKGLTHQTIIPMEEVDSSFLSWVVYTNNPKNLYDVKYLAHYVNEAGEYLYWVPVSAPMSASAMDSSGAELVFLDMTADTHTQEVTLFNGTKRQITVPVMTDSDGTVYLGDVQRKIICADYLAWEEDETLAVRQSENGRFTDGELLTYESIIHVWDFYNELNWPGPDGEGTPTLLLMDWVEDGEPVRNACYSGHYHGFQVFQFNRIDRDGECLDLIGHEFTHCVTDKLTGECPYLNDNGAINEALSDIMGNLMEEMLDASDDPDWLIGEGAQDPEMIIRCMSDPHLYGQPAYVWDQYYMPAAEEATDDNDCGGVHSNSSLLNLIAWRLREAGMSAEDEFDFFMNVILASPSRITYPQMALLLPWCLEQADLSAYAQALENAITETGIASEWPDRIPEGCALLAAELPGDLPLGNMTLELCYLRADDEEDNGLYYWPDSRLGMLLSVVPAGEYVLILAAIDEEGYIVAEWVLTDAGWEEIPEGFLDEIDPEEYAYALDADAWYELPTEGLAESFLAEDVW